MNPDEAAIRTVLDHFWRAFEERDAELYAASFTDDADWENSFGGRARGREAIEDFLRRVYPLFHEAQQELIDVRVRLVTEDVAVTDVVRDLTGQVTERGASAPPRRVRTTHVLRRDEAGWQVVVHRAADLRSRSGS